MLLKAWQRRVSGIMDTDNPEEEKLIHHFNKDFTRLLQAVPKAERRILFDMLHIINRLYNKESAKKFRLGLYCGYKGSIQHGQCFCFSQKYDSRKSKYL